MTIEELLEAAARSKRNIENYKKGKCFFNQTYPAYCKNRNVKLFYYCEDTPLFFVGFCNDCSVSLSYYKEVSEKELFTILIHY